MATPRETVWSPDPHTLAKHEILRHYLTAWFAILGSKFPRIIYVDGFSGPGSYTNGEPGSPLIALDVARDCKPLASREVLFWFVEADRDRLAHLQRALAARNIPTNFRVFPKVGKFAESANAIIASLREGGQSPSPAFALVDPFGFSGVPFSAIRALMENRHSEVLVTLMADAMNRWLEHPEGKITEHICEAFGCDDALDVARGPGNRVTGLRDLYQRRLETVAEFVRPFEMRDRANRPQYYLFFASHHHKGYVKMKEAMWKVDPDTGCRFSDAADPLQLVLPLGAAVGQLASDLRRAFSGKGPVTGHVVREHIELETPYLKKHMRAALKDEEATGCLTVEPVQTDGRKRIRGTYPDMATLTWR